MNENIHEKDLVHTPIVAYKDSLFRMLFKKKKELLNLYNAINGTAYNEPSELEVTTLENAIYMTMKNDVSCVLNMNLNLYEQQSTVNPNLELIVEQYNINKGYNSELLKNCRELNEYMIYVDTVRKNCETMSLEKAVESAVDACISNGILREFLMNNKAEVTRMSIFEYDEELHSRTLLEEGIEIGLERGEKIGQERERMFVARKMLDKGMTIEEIIELAGLSEEEINCVNDIEV